jgi:hypothetical protein
MNIASTDLTTFLNAEKKRMMNLNGTHQKAFANMIVTDGYTCIVHFSQSKRPSLEELKLAVHTTVYR